MNQHSNPTPPEHLPELPMYEYPECYLSSYLGQFAEESRFYSKLLDDRFGRGAKVLELAAGNGRISVEMAKMGYEVWALDREARMLEDLQRRARSSSVRVQTLESDFKGPIPSKIKWDAVVCPLSVVSTICDFDAVVHHYQSVADRLIEGGLVIYVLIAAENSSGLGSHNAYWDCEKTGFVSRSWFEYRKTVGRENGIFDYCYRIHFRSDSKEVLLVDRGLLRIYDMDFLKAILTSVPSLRFRSWHPMFDSEVKLSKPPSDAEAIVLVLEKSS